MRRDPDRLEESFDVVVVGAGIYGICAAWDAAQRGLKTALLERDDFCARTSANSLKIAHGGLRYLQKGAFGRMRRSIRERRALLRVAPHLVRPLPCLMATRRSPPTRTRLALRCALGLNDLLSWDRNRGVDPLRALPRGRTIPRDRCLEAFPGLAPDGVTGGALWYDGLILNTERLALGWLHRAAAAGAVLLNRFEVTGVLRRDGRIAGVRGRDRVADREHEVAARVVLDTCGPWSGRLDEKTPRPPLSLALNLVSRRPLVPPDHALAVGRGKGRLFFLVPWRGRTMVGTAYFESAGDRCEVEDAHVERFVADVNEAFPAAALAPDDVALVHAGLLPGPPDRLFDRPRIDESPGLVRVLGVKWTTARAIAERAVDLCFRQLDRTPAPCRTAELPVHGGDRADLDALAAETGLGDDLARALVQNHGSSFGDVLRYRDEAAGVLPATAVLEAEVLHAVRDEMALGLDDVVFRRTDLGSAGSPGDEALEACARLVERELGWAPERTAAELEGVRVRFRSR